MRSITKKSICFTIFIQILCLLMFFYASTARGEGEELIINEPKDMEFIHEGDVLNYYCDAPAGSLTLKITEVGPISDLKIEVTIAEVETRANKSDIIEEAENTAGQDLTINFELEEKMTIYINVSQVEDFGSYTIEISDTSGFAMSLLPLMVIIGLSAITILFVVIGSKQVKAAIKKVKKEMDTSIPIPTVYKTLLKQYSGMNNLSILDAVENKAIETELKTIGIGHYTTYHTSHSGGYSRSYATTTPYTYTIRYNSLVEMETKDGKTHLKMKLKTGKNLFQKNMIMIYVILAMGVIFGLVFMNIPYIGDYSLFMSLPMLLIAVLMSIILPRVLIKSYKKTAEDQFQLLVKKPVIAMQLGSEGEGFQIAQVDKTVAKVAQKAEAKFCPFCGKENPSGSKICENCGAEQD